MTSILPSPLTSGFIIRISPDRLRTRRCLASRGSLPRDDADAIVAGLKGTAPGHRGGQGALPARCRGHPHERRDAPHRAHRPRGQAPAHRPQPQRSGGAGRAACMSRTPPDEAATLLAELLHALLDPRRKSTLHTIMPGYTHLQKAQPITLAPSPDGLCSRCSRRDMQRAWRTAYDDGGRHAPGLRRAGGHDLSAEP